MVRKHYWRNLVVFGFVSLVIGLIGVFYILLPVNFAMNVAHPARTVTCCVNPADLGAIYENVSFPTEDHLTLRGWYIPSENRAAIIIAHGIGGNRSSFLEAGIALAKRGYGVLLFDLRAHGESDGVQISFRGEDVVAAVNFLKQRQDVDPYRIGALGVSLGGLVTLQAAAVDQDIRAIVTDGLAANAYRDLPLPGTLVQWLDSPYQRVTYLTWELKGITAPLSTLEAVQRVSPRPILFISGAASAQEKAAQRKYFAAASQPKQLWEVPNAGHTGSWRADPAAYAQRIGEFFDQALLGQQYQP